MLCNSCRQPLHYSAISYDIKSYCSFRAQ
ncbi:hypothetical protein D7V86_02970 [bacterium D16-51]|nr:hypothetical protein D7V96_02680 [bacterium D16-59]RKI62088.1 hypothetical protein D7V86_02970 [bacterium D16-51]